MCVTSPKYSLSYWRPVQPVLFLNDVFTTLCPNPPPHILPCHGNFFPSESQQPVTSTSRSNSNRICSSIYCTSWLPSVLWSHPLMAAWNLFPSVYGVNKKMTYNVVFSSWRHKIWPKVYYRDLCLVFFNILFFVIVFFMFQFFKYWLWHVKCRFWNVCRCTIVFGSAPTNTRTFTQLQLAVDRVHLLELLMYRKCWAAVLKKRTSCCITGGYNWWLC